MEKNKRKRGRPIRGDARNNQCVFRTTDKQIRRLKVASQLSGKSQADILREALDKELELLRVPGSNGYDYCEEFDVVEQENESC